MKKILPLILMCSTLISCGGGSTLPSKGSVDQGDHTFAPRPSNIRVGDPMPYFDNGKMNIFYLAEGPKTGVGFHPIYLYQTEDYINYDHKGEAIPYVNSIYEPEVGLGTGSVIKDKNGLYHFFYTGFNNSSSSGLPYNEKIMHATSSDLLNWTKHPEHAFYGNHNDFRDPYVLYMENEACYWMLITTRVNSKAVIAKYKSTDLISWNYDGVFYSQNTANYNMECPTLINFNGYWYLTFSEQGAERVTRYRYTESLTNPNWITPKNDYIDRQGFYAGRLEKDDQGRMFAIGWCAEKEGEFDLGNFDWGGELIVHEVDNKVNGELLIKPVKEVLDLLSNEVGYKGIPSSISTSKNFEMYRGESLSQNMTRISFDIMPKSSKGIFGIGFDIQENNELSNIAFAINFEADCIEFYNDISSKTLLGTPQLVSNFDFRNGQTYHVELLIQDEIAILYINNTIALSTRMYEMVEEDFAFFSLSSIAEISDIHIYE